VSDDSGMTGRRKLLGGDPGHMETSTKANGGNEWEGLQLNLESHILYTTISLILNCPGNQESLYVFGKTAAPDRHVERLGLYVKYLDI